MKNEDIKKGVPLAWLSYFGILLLIPFLIQKDNPYTKYHVKQGLMLLICGIAVSFVAWIPILGWLIAIIALPTLFVLWIIGIIRALIGKARPLPIIGKYAEKFQF